MATTQEEFNREKRLERILHKVTEGIPGFYIFGPDIINFVRKELIDVELDAEIVIKSGQTYYLTTESHTSRGR